MIEQVDEAEPEELDCKTIQNWYEHASNELSNFCNLQFPKFCHSSKSNAIACRRINLVSHEC